MLCSTLIIIIIIIIIAKYNNVDKRTVYMRPLGTLPIVADYSNVVKRTIYQTPWHIDNIG